ncbi:DNA mismatch repair ATPase msh1 [Myotisia sp. PD_48]|nr:DNA mismatch repair ATPase msh1 [Myotisia sp. PD_48]
MRLPVWHGRLIGSTVERRLFICRKRPLTLSLDATRLNHGPIRRGAKTRSTVKLKDLVQGPLEARKPLAALVNDTPQYPTVIQGARYNMQKFSNCVVLTRVGSFYELYFHQAEKYAALLNLKLAYKKTNAGSVPMAGFPFYQLDRFLKILVQDLKCYVAISEEFANDAAEKAKSGGLLFDRKVARVVTPGTLIDEKFVDHHQNNFLLAIYINPVSVISPPSEEDGSSRGQFRCLADSENIGLSWLDLSTGDFLTQTVTPQMLPSAVACISAREVLIDGSIHVSLQNELKALALQEHQHLTFFQRTIPAKPISDWNSLFDSPVSYEESSSFTLEETIACQMVLEYAQEQMKTVEIGLQAPRQKIMEESMSIDRSSLKGLEILQTSRDGFGKGSLLHAVRRTSTMSGARLLRDRLVAPSTSLNVINDRLDLVELFLQDVDFRDIVLQLLKQSYDVQRLVQKFSLGRGNPDDLICLSRAISASREIKLVLVQKLQESEPSTADPIPQSSLQRLVDRLNLEEPEKLSRRISEAIDEEGLLQQQRLDEDEAADDSALALKVVRSEGSPADLKAMPGMVKNATRNTQTETSEAESPGDNTWIMRRDASDNLRNLHLSLGDLHSEKTNLTEKLRKEAGTTNLNLKWTPGLGHIVHMKGVKAIQSSLHALGVTRTVSASKSTRSFYLASWTQLGSRMEDVKQQIRVEEQRIFKELRQAVILNLVKLRQNAGVLDELDVACSFAILAKEQHMVRPILNDGFSHRIVGGRHPTVKIGLEEQGRPFVSNDCFLDGKERIWLITGPNMAGKSTFLRQNALITILAHIGSFVPADYAEIGLVDKIFSRIGAADDVFHDQSTFMVEMLETATILRNATARSFVIMDEVGRGTTPEDGTAVGFACLHHLHNVNRSRTLFATHFHALADMTKDFERVGRYCTDLKEHSSSSFSFIHKLRSGVNRQSHALKVAHLAGLPLSVINTARNVLENMPTIETGPEIEERPADEAKCSVSRM